MLLLDSEKYRCGQHSVCGVGEKDAGDDRGGDRMNVILHSHYKGHKEHEGRQDRINRSQSF
jgi:hypothetical protein